MRIFFSLQTCFMLNLLTSSSICSIFPQISRNQQSCCLGVSFPRRRSYGFVTRDKPLRTSAWEATSGFHCWVVVQSTIGSLSSDVFERRTSTGSEVFSLLTCLDDIKFVFLSFFTVIEAIWLKICAKPPSKFEKRPLPVDVRRSELPNRDLKQRRCRRQWKRR